MKRFGLIAMLLGSVLAFGQTQTARFDGVAQIARSLNGASVLSPAPNAQITVCGYPATGGIPCTNRAALCPDDTGAGCTTGAPNNPVMADAQGNFGFWIAPGKFQYTVCPQSGPCWGPYTGTLGSASVNGQDISPRSITTDTLAVGTTVTKKLNDNRWNVSQFDGADFGEQLQAAHDAASAGDILDASMMRGTQVLNSTVTFSKSVTVMLPDATVTNNVAVGFQVNSKGDKWIGSRVNGCIGGSGTNLKQMVAGIFVQLGTDNGHAWDAGDYDGAGGNQDFTNLCFSTASTTPLTNGGANYLPGSTAVKDWRGGSLTFTRVGFQEYDWWFWGIQSDINKMYDVSAVRNHSGAFFGPRSDQLTVYGGWSGLNDNLFVFDSSYGWTFHGWVTDSDGSSTTTPWNVVANYPRGAGNGVFDAVWFENFSSPAGVAVPAFVSLGVSSPHIVRNVSFENPVILTNKTPTTPRTIALVKLDNATGTIVSSPRGQPTDINGNVDIDTMLAKVGDVDGVKARLVVGAQNITGWSTQAGTGTLKVSVDDTVFPKFYGSLLSGATSISPWNSTYAHIANTVPTTVNFLGPEPNISWPLQIICDDGNTTFANSDSMHLMGDFVCSTGAALNLFFDGTRWHEVARTANINADTVGGYLPSALPVSTPQSTAIGVETTRATAAEAVLTTAVAGKVPTTTTVNSHALSANVTIEQTVPLGTLAGAMSGAVGTAASVTWTPVLAVTIDQLAIVSLSAQAAGCSTPVTIGVYDNGVVTGCTLSIPNGNWMVSAPGSCSTAITAGHQVVVKISTQGVGCSTFPTTAVVYVQHH